MWTYCLFPLPECNQAAAFLLHALFYYNIIITLFPLNLVTCRESWPRYINGGRNRIEGGFYNCIVRLTRPSLWFFYLLSLPFPLLPCVIPLSLSARETRAGEKEGGENDKSVIKISQNAGKTDPLPSTTVVRWGRKKKEKYVCLLNVNQNCLPLLALIRSLFLAMFYLFPQRWTHCVPLFRHSPDGMADLLPRDGRGGGGKI